MCTDSNTLHFRAATEADALRIWDIIGQAKRLMATEGREQWDDTYPTPALIRDDIRRGAAYVIDDGERAMAFCAVFFSGEPAYERIDGRWLTEGPYVVVHRMAVSDEVRRQGLARRLIGEVETLARARGMKSFRVDTNHDNAAMLHLFRILGFQFCGTICYQQGSRMAFEKSLL